jgi:bacterioferritin
MNNHLSLSGTRMRRGDFLPRGTGNASAADGQPTTAMAISLLHEALVIARGVAARCERQYYAALRNYSPALAAAALEHANEARVQAESLAARIIALGGTPVAQAEAGAPHIPAEPRDGHSLVAVIGGYLVAAHSTIESYRQIATLMESCDRPTQVLLESIVSGEEERASHLAALLEQISAPQT